VAALSVVMLTSALVLEGYCTCFRCPAWGSPRRLALLSSVPEKARFAYRH
jgi:hypothetical protein